MDDSATPVHVVEAQQYLLRNLLDKVHWHPFVLVTLDQAQQVLTENFENHADVHAVRPLVSEMVEETDNMRSARMGVRWRGRGIRIRRRWSNRRCGGGNEAL